MEDWSGLLFYKTVLNEWLAIDFREPEYEVYYSPDGVRFLQLYVGGYSSNNGVMTSYSVTNPHPGCEWEGKIVRQDGGFVLSIPQSCSLPYFLLSEPPELGYEFFSKPVVMQLMEVFTLPNGLCVLWTQSKYDRPYTDVHLYFGKAESLNEFKVEKVSAGGIHTAIGVLEFGLRRFGGYTLTKLNEKRFELKIDGLKISLVSKE